KRQFNHPYPGLGRYAPRANRRPACPALYCTEPRIRGGLQRREDGGAAARPRVGPRKAENREPASAPDLRKPDLAEPLHRESVLRWSARADVQHPPAHPRADRAVEGARPGRRQLLSSPELVSDVP